jgi:hypothetical protein
MLKLIPLVFLLASSAFCADPTSRPTTQPAPADADVDWLLKQAKPAGDAKTEEKPTSQPSPFAAKKDPDTRAGTITLSNGEKIHGTLSHTADKPVRIWVEADQEYRDVPFKLIASFEAKVTKEYDEKEWHFKESGSDIKEFTGKTYPVRETSYTVTLVNGQTITGGIVEPIYLKRPEGPITFSILKRDKGEVGKTLKELVFVQRVDFDDAKPGK